VNERRFHPCPFRGSWKGADDHRDLAAGTSGENHRDLAGPGQLELLAQDLGLDGGPLYDPLGNYRRVADSWSDWASV